jgi:hypothetical protein
MNRKHFTILTALMWLALPLTAVRYWQVWDELPVRMATHFGAHSQPNGWMSREDSLYFTLGLTAFMLVIFTAIAYFVQKQKAADASSFALLGFFYLILGFMFYVNNSILAHNLNGQPVTVAPVLLGVPIAIVVFALIYLRAQRGPALPNGQTLAEEVHGSKLFATLFASLAVLEFAVFAAMPGTSVRVAMGAMCVLFLVIAAHAWDGFHYRITPSGIEISTLGYRLRSIPQAHIAKYRVEKWMAYRGYGVRGVGNTRAYVWGNNVVHISTQDGEVFLGHNDPARLVRDLDQMKQFTHS